jgi:hypothetical protein
MDAGVQATQATGSKRNETVSGDHPRIQRKPAGRKPRTVGQTPPILDMLVGVTRHCWPDLNHWLNDLPDPRSAPMCRYSGAHIWWEVIMTFLTRGGSRNAFDVDRNTGLLPENIQRICGQAWDEERLGETRTVTCSENAIHHANRVETSMVEQFLLKMVRRLMHMRMLDAGRLFGSWWCIAMDGTLQQRAKKNGCKFYCMVLEARLMGPFGIELPLMVEFLDVHDPIRDKKDCELRGFDRLSRRLHAEFPRLSICLLLDGLYAVKAVFDRCKEYGWKFIITMKEGRQRTAFDEAVQTMLMSPSHVWKSQRMGEHGIVDQTARWAEQVPVSDHPLNVIFLGEIAPHAATLWAWVTNLRLDIKRVGCVIASGQDRFRHEENFNVLKNNGYGLEHAFCTPSTASKNYHIMLLVADTIWQILADGVLVRLKHLARKLTDISFVRHMFAALIYVPISPNLPRIGQIRFAPG